MQACTTKPAEQVCVANVQRTKFHTSEGTMKLCCMGDCSIKYSCLLVPLLLITLQQYWPWVLLVSTHVLGISQTGLTGCERSTISSTTSNTSPSP